MMSHPEDELAESAASTYLEARSILSQVAETIQMSGAQKSDQIYRLTKPC